MFCPKCGSENKDDAIKCVKCAELLRQVKPDDALGGLIPYKNVPALVSYYLGVFSIIPCIGLFLGIAAFILGIKGLQIHKAHPESKGKAHALIGIIVGGFFGLLYLALTVIFIVAMGTARR